MTVTVVLATRNAKKLEEMHRLLVAAGLAIEVRGTDAFADLPEIAETGASFTENALIKARAVAAHTGLPSIADDSGLCVDALNGMPGVRSARWAGSRASDEANVDLVLEQIADVPDDRRNAHFECSAALVLPTASGGSMSETVVERRVNGYLLRQRRGTGGFGYDPVFVPMGHDRTTAEMSPEEKDAISHRGQAMRALLPALSALTGAGGGT